MSRTCLVTVVTSQDHPRANHGTAPLFPRRLPGGYTHGANRLAREARQRHPAGVDQSYAELAGEHGHHSSGQMLPLDGDPKSAK